MRVTSDWTEETRVPRRPSCGSPIPRGLSSVRKQRGGGSVKKDLGLLVPLKDGCRHLWRYGSTNGVVHRYLGDLEALLPLFLLRPFQPY